MTQALNVHIGKLVLYGFAPANRDRIGHAVELELKRLIRERGIPSAVIRNGDLAGLEGGSFQVSSSSEIDKIGGQIARSVHAGFGK